MEAGGELVDRICLNELSFRRQELDIRGGKPLDLDKNRWSQVLLVPGGRNTPDRSGGFASEHSDRPRPGRSPFHAQLS